MKPFLVGFRMDGSLVKVSDARTGEAGNGRVFYRPYGVEICYVAETPEEATEMAREHLKKILSNGKKCVGCGCYSNNNGYLIVDLGWFHNKGCADRYRYRLKKGLTTVYTEDKV